MPFLISFSLAAIGGLLALKFLQAEQRRVAEVMARQQSRKADRGVDLVRDPQTGQYRPRED